MRTVAEVPNLNPFPHSPRPDALSVTAPEAVRELVATNEMSIINANAIEGKADVRKVSPEDGERIPKYGLWWRYRFDVGDDTTS